MSTQIINCTPHPVIVLAESNVVFDKPTRSFRLNKGGQPIVMRTFVPSGVCPRCSQQEEECEAIDGIDVWHMSYGAVDNLPDPKSGVVYIVSQLVAAACPERHDLVVPAHIVRGAAGQVIGCLGFGRI